MSEIYEPWRMSGALADAGACIIWDANGNEAARTISGTDGWKQQRAARIVACVNFCEGTDSEHLIDSNLGRLQSISTRDRLHAELAAANAARLELLAALKALLPKGWDDGMMDHMPAIKVARTAIAKHGG